MAHKTIYIKDEKKDLYDRAVRYSGEKSLSSLLEKIVEKTVKENEENLRDALMMVAAERSGVTSHIGTIIDLAKKSISKENWNRAEYIMDIFEEKGFFKDGEWKGTKGDSEAGSDYFWMETMVQDDDSSLNEMYELATSPKFKEIEEEVNTKKKKVDQLSEMIVKELPKILLELKNIDKEKFLEGLSKFDNNLEKALYLINYAEDMVPGWSLIEKNGSKENGK